MKKWEEIRDQWYAEDVGMKDRVEAEREQLRVSAELRQARKESGLTQREVAEKMHVKREYISRLENTPKNMKLSTLIRYTQSVGKRFDIAIHA
jgi:predicted transcriptional regulator